jgi:hypothetical protein
MTYGTKKYSNDLFEKPDKDGLRDLAWEQVEWAIDHWEELPTQIASWYENLAIWQRLLNAPMFHRKGLP